MMLALWMAATLRRRSRRASAKAKRAMRRDALDALDHAGGDLVFDTRVEVFGVLAHHDEIDAREGRAHALPAPGRAHVGVEVEGLAQGDVDAAVARAADLRLERALERHAIAADRGEERIGNRRAELLEGGAARE